MAEIFEYLALALTFTNHLTPILGVIGGLILGAADFQARIVTMMAGLEEYLGQPIRFIPEQGPHKNPCYPRFTTPRIPAGY